MSLNQSGKIGLLFSATMVALFSNLAAACSKPDTTNYNQNNADAPQSEVAAFEPAIEETEKPKVSQEIATPPEQSGKPKVLSSRDEVYQDAPSCIYTISYQPRTDHEVRWKGNKCSDLAASFMTVAQLDKYEKLEKLDDPARAALIKNNKQGVFYVEGEFTASIYPQDDMGIPRELSVAD